MPGQGGKYKIGDRVVFTCNQGFVHFGSNQRRCLTTGKWSGTDTQCKGMLLIHYDDDDDNVDVHDDDHVPDDGIDDDEYDDVDDNDDDVDDDDDSDDGDDVDDDDDDGNDVDDYDDQNDFPFYYSLNKLFYVHRVNSTFTTRISVMINIRVKFIGKYVINNCLVV